jgi:hypothetical protein
MSVLFKNEGVCEYRKECVPRNLSRRRCIEILPCAKECSNEEADEVKGEYSNRTERSLRCLCTDNQQHTRGGAQGLRGLARAQMGRFNQAAQHSMGAQVPWGGSSDLTKSLQ